MQKYGFTLVEVLLTMTIMTILASFAVVSLIGLQHRTYLMSRTNTLVTDIRAQQVKAMIGESDIGGNIVARGIHFDTDRYVLFRGSVYNASDDFNFAVSLENELKFTGINFPGGDLIFSAGSGEPVNYSTGADSITLQQDQGGLQKTITINKYGTVTQIN